MIRGVEALREAYRRETVARTYLEERFRQPLGALLHARQVAAVRRLLTRVAPARVLEIGPGPARVTAEIVDAFTGQGVLMDASVQMLSEACRRLGRSTAWRAVQGDAFALPFCIPFDVVYTFRLIRHFERKERIRLYTQIGCVLKQGGWLMFDAVNRHVSEPLRAASRPGEYRHFDALLRPDELRDELTEAGFRLQGLQGVQYRYPLLSRIQVLVAPRSRFLARAAMECVDRYGGEPLEWIVTCQRE